MSTLVPLLPDANAWLELLGRTHVLVVHFPIALLWMAGLAELVRIVRRSEERSPTAFACLSLGALAAVASASLGWLHAELEPLGSSVERTVFLHRWSGVGTAAVSLLAWLFAFGAGRLYRVFLLITVGLVSVAGYLGGSLVYGEGYFLDALREGPAPMETTSTNLPAETVIDVGPVSYTFDVEPLLRARCFKCHGPKRRKGGLRLDDLAVHYERAEEDWVIRPGDAAGSELHRRITLPPNDEDAMPNEGDPLTPEQIAVLRAWIDQGASTEP